jgi:hypothetical protein
LLDKFRFFNKITRNNKTSNMMFRSTHPSKFKSKANENCIPLQKETQAYLTKKVIATERCKQLLSQAVKREALEKHYQFVHQ